MYRHINQASQVTTAIIPLIHVMWMNESLFLSLSLFQTQLTVGINASYSFVFLSLRTQNTDVYTLTMYMWTVSEKTALETHSGKLLHYGVSDSHSTKKETKINKVFVFLNSSWSYLIRFIISLLLLIIVVTDMSRQRR